MKYTIAIDGPAASGKSSAADMASKILGFYRLDSGALYRAITYVLVKDGEPWALDDAATRKKIELMDFSVVNQKIFFKENDITEYLHVPNVDKVIGTVAKELYVRQKVHELQNNLINNAKDGIVVDGRDIGTVVMPNAFLKIFITAKDTTRAARRVKQTTLSYEEVLRDIQKRDYQDIHREHGPLKCADDAVVIENDDMSLKETADRIVQLFEKKKASVN